MEETFWMCECRFRDSRDLEVRDQEDNLASHLRIEWRFHSPKASLHRQQWGSGSGVARLKSSQESTKGSMKTVAVRGGSC